MSARCRVRRLLAPDAGFGVDYVEDLGGIRLALSASRACASSTMSGYNIAFVFTGSVAAYKACDVVSRLVQLGHTVRAVVTSAALRLSGPPHWRASPASASSRTCSSRAPPWSISSSAAGPTR